MKKKKVLHVDFYLNISETLNLHFLRNTEKLKTTKFCVCFQPAPVVCHSLQERQRNQSIT